MPDQPIASVSLVWFREDLRLADNPALHAAVQTGDPLVCLYVLDEDSPCIRPLGGASRWWLAGSLRALQKDIGTRGGRLLLRRGPASIIVPEVIAQAGARRLFFNRRFEPNAAAADRSVAGTLQKSGIEVTSFNGSLLHDPGSLVNRAGEPMRVFTPFWRTLVNRLQPRAPLPTPERFRGSPPLPSDRLEDWGLEPRAPDWAEGLRQAFDRGEAGAHARLHTFLRSGLGSYATERDYPDRDASSRLSPHLRFGEISPHQLWDAAEQAWHGASGARASAENIDKLRSEIGWREFNYHLLHDHDLARENINKRFNDFPFMRDGPSLEAWQSGRTGYPIVDAGMRQLWRTGWMHNRVRLITASFLVKHLLIDWREGEAWFWDTLVDADPANNPANWQWVAGSGADAAPYFRIFNPVLQGETFDPGGAYVRRFVPELARMPDQFIHKPWMAPALVLEQAGVALGRTYPSPIVDHKAARQRALAAFASLKTP